MRHDAEILAMVPADLPAHKALGELVEMSAKRLLEPSRATRDIPMLALGVGGAGVFGWLAVWSFQRDSGWGIVLGVIAGFLWLVFFFGIFEAAQLKDREAEKAEKDRKKAEKARQKAAQADGGRQEPT